MPKHWPIAFSLCLCLFLASCQKGHVFNASKTIALEGWHKDSIARFKLPVLDSVQKYNLFINVRNTNNYAFSNLYLIAKLQYPNGKQRTDTLQYVMAKPNGEWLGIGATSLKENKLWYLENFQFNENKNYTVNIRQAMRVNGNTNGLINLEGITDIGIQIETAIEQP